MPSDLQVSNIKDLAGSNTGLSIASDGQVTIGNLKSSINTLNPFYDDSQIAFWKFEDNLNDEHSNYNLTGSNIVYRTGFLGKGMDCTASNYATIPQFSALTSFSLSFRIKLDSLNTAKYIIGNQTTGQMFHDNGELKIYQTSGTGTWTGSPTISTGTIHHVVLSVSSGVPFLYLNNHLYIGNSLTSIQWGASSSWVGYIGTASTQAGVSTYAMDGMMDEVRVFNKALTSGEVSTLYTRDI